MNKHDTGKHYKLVDIPDEHAYIRALNETRAEYMRITGRTENEDITGDDVEAWADAKGYTFNADGRRVTLDPKLL